MIYESRVYTALPGRLPALLRNEAQLGLASIPIGFELERWTERAG